MIFIFCRPFDVRCVSSYLNDIYDLILELYIRQTVNEAVWPSPNTAEKPIYIPAKTRYRPCTCFMCFKVTDEIFSVVYSAFLMQRRTDLWGPDGTRLQIHTDRPNNSSLNSPWIWSRPLSWPPDKEIPDRQSVHIRPLQCWPADLSWSTS